MYMYMHCIHVHVHCLALCLITILSSYDISLQVNLSETISTAAARGAVEKWLLQVQDIMIMSIRDVIEESKDVSHQIKQMFYVQ